MKNVKHFTQKYIDWVIKLGRFKFSLLGFLVLSSFALCTQIVLSLIVLGDVDWHNLIYSIIFGLISAPFVIYFFTVLVEKLELSRLDLAKSIQDKSTLLATISHELRTPLNGILGLSRILLDSNLSSEQRNYVNIISISAVSLGHIFNDIIDLEKIDASRIELYKQKTDFLAFLSDIQHIAALMASQKNLSFEMKCGHNLEHFVMLDCTRLSQILWNLLSNAVKFTEKGKISLRVERLSDSQYCFLVEDTGQGIRSSELDKIFTMYYQAKDNTKKAAGTGIGLSISKSIAHLMNGDLTVDSQFGVGSTFKLVITAEPVNEILKENLEIQSAVKNLKILLVEDIELNVIVAKSLLEKLGHHVDVAMSGNEAINAVENHVYDLVLLDIQLPDMTGFDVAEHLTTAYKNNQYDYLPLIIALTANVIQHKSEYQKKGFDDVLHKPLSASALIQCLNYYFDYESDKDTKNENRLLSISIPENLSQYFDVIALKQLLSFMSIQDYIDNIKLFSQLVDQDGELNLFSAYNKYQQGLISQQDFVSVAHKLKGASASLAMNSVQEIANLIQQYEQEHWQDNLFSWIEQIEKNIEQSLKLVNIWLASMK